MHHKYEANARRGAVSGENHTTTVIFSIFFSNTASWYSEVGCCKYRISDAPNVSDLTGRYGKGEFIRD